MTDELAIVRALGAGAQAVGPVGAARWEVTLAGGTPFDVRVRAAGGWLTFDGPLYDGVPSARALLERNAMLDGGARIVLAPVDPTPRVRADVPLDDDVDLARRVVDACAGIERARTGAVGGGRDVSPDTLALRCGATGWRIAEREPGLVAVDLDVPGAFQQATIAVRNGATIVEAGVAEGEPASDVCRRALAMLLLRVAGTVRMVRPTGAARFEVGFDGDACATELAHAFAALSVACRLSCREASVLQHDEHIARAYLAQNEGGE